MKLADGMNAPSAVLLFAAALEPSAGELTSFLLCAVAVIIVGERVLSGLVSIRAIRKTDAAAAPVTREEFAIFAVKVEVKDKEIDKSISEQKEYLHRMRHESLNNQHQIELKLERIAVELGIKFPPRARVLEEEPTSEAG